MKNYLDGGEAIIEAFRRLDIDYVMASPGSEWGSVWEAFARQDANKADGPTYLSCAHETLAVNLAMGYSVMTGRMQAVMLHTGVGLLQGSMGIDAANRQGVPMVVVSGESLTYSEQEGFEPGPQWQGLLSVVGGPANLVQAITKWSQAVSSPFTLHEQLIRAGEMAQRSPAGPVYMSVPVSESWWSDFTNFPKDHALYQGIGNPEYLHDADVVLTLRSRAPWSPPGNRPAGATIVNIDEAPFRSHMVHQNLQADIFLEGDAVATLQALIEAVRRKGIDDAAVAARRARWSKGHDALVARKQAQVDEALAKDTISPIGLCATLGDVLPDDTIYIDETITSRRSIIEHIDFKGPLSFFSVASGGLGQGLGLALGAKLAMKDRPVVSVIGDGSFMYNPVTQSLALSQHKNIPIMIVVFNNAGYSAMRKEHHAYYPDGVAAASNASEGFNITDVDYAELGKPFGFYGRRVEALADLPGVLKEAYAATLEGRTAIVNVILDEGAPAKR